MKLFKQKRSQLKAWSSLPILVCISLLITPLQAIFSHGTVTYPPSRVWICFQENPESPDSPACEDAIIGWGTQAFYDWSEVARMDAGGMHRAIIDDGNLASAGRPDKYGGLDQVRDDWVATPVTPGPFTVTWSLSAPHATLYYDIYITKADWTPDQPLTWDSLELLTRTEPRPISPTDNIDIVLPARTGKHVLYSVWQRSLTPEAFYSTSDIDFGTEALPNEAPVASFTSDNGRCGGSEVTFNAEETTDRNGDALTYSWDFGDGNTAEGEIVTHTYAGLDSALVTLTVSDNEFSSFADATVNLVQDPDCNEIVCPFDTPRDSPLPTIQGSYRGITVIGEGGPVLDDHKLDINWNFENNGLYQFSLQSFGESSIWTNLIPVTTQTFNQIGPMVTIGSSRFEGLEGSYYVSVDGENFIMASTTGNFTMYFSELASDPAPDCGDGTSVPVPTPVSIDGGTLSGGPFTFTVGDGIADNVSGVTLSGNVGENSQYIVTDSTGNILGLPPTPEAVDFDGAGEGRCFIYHLSYNGTISGLEVGNTIAGISGDFDISNSVDVNRNPVIEPGVGNVVYDEGTDGNLSAINTAPTVIELAVGNNRVISGQEGAADQANFFTIQIPAGYQLSQLIVDSYEGADAIGFIGIDKGAIIGGQPASNAPSSLIGGLSYGTANVGTNILPEMGDLDNPAAAFVDGFGFTPPLASEEYAVWLNQTGGASTTTLNFVVTLIEEEPVIEEPITGGDCTFGTPLSTPLPTTGHSPYQNVHVLGTGGPNMDSVTKFTVNWDLENEGLYQFSFDMNASPWYSNFSNNAQSFSQSNPSITLTGTSIAGLDGTYYAAIDGENFVLVGDGYSIYFSNSDTAPDCDGASAKAIEAVAFNMFPNPAVSDVTITSDADLNGSLVTITDLSGKAVKSVAVSTSTNSLDISLAGLQSGLYLVTIAIPGDFSRTLKLIIE